ncbi:MAG TPA: hypothetical protein VJA66_16265 [Thermoanaerobaculia bacterium]
MNSDRRAPWVKSLGGAPGSGFVRVWGRKEAPKDLSWLRAVAAHEPAFSVNR